MKLKTWEMIKALSENQNLKFASPIPSHIVMFNPISKRIEWLIDGKYEDFILISNKECGIDNLHIEWELVRESVSWQEAFQAWADGKSVYVTLNGFIKQYIGDGEYLKIKNISRGISVDEITKGKWYIEE